MKQFIADLFGIKTYEEELKKTSYERDSIATQLAKLQLQYDNIKVELDFYKLKDEDKVKVLMGDVHDLARTYEERIAEYEDVADKCNKMIDNMDRMAHREFARGRQAAYSEMGIWRLDALDAGNRLVMDACGNVYELLNDLEDVKASNDNVNTVSTSEIEIDDLL